MAEVNINFKNGNISEKNLFIIDCDAGTDDALALLLALNPKLASNVDVLGITCVGGNTSLDNVVRNVLRTLKIANREDVPIFKGATMGLSPRDPHRHSRIHGTDGLGGIAHTVPVSEAQVDAVMKRENAVDWLGRIVMEYPAGSITLITLGPLTNPAFAHRLFPDYHSRLKRLVVMGGNLNARGNWGLTSEFNFGCDPEAAQVVLEEFTCPITIIPFDTCILHCFPFDWYERTLSTTNSIKANFVRSIFQSKHDYIKSLYPKGDQQFYACDWMAMVCALNPPDTVTESVSHYAAVELNGQLTRGMMVVDWRNWKSTPEGGGKRKMEMITKFDLEKLKEMFEKTLL